MEDLYDEENEFEPTPEDLEKVEEIDEELETRFPQLTVDPEELELAIKRTGNGVNPFL